MTTRINERPTRRAERRRSTVACAIAACLSLGIGERSNAADSLADVAKSFAAPPPTARPWVYWTWIDGNVNEAGITADLEAMNRVGIGGAIILDVDQETPRGPVHFFDERWKALFKHTISEARRLGMEINVNDGVGYFGSGGPWVTPDRAMQCVVQSETHVVGGKPFAGTLPLPTRAKEYRDVAVIAVAEPDKDKRSKYRIPDLAMKALQWRAWVGYRGTESSPLDAVAPADAIVPQDKVVDLTDRMRPDGSIDWDTPAGEWTILRFGHAWTGATVGPAVKADTGPETDKFDKAATRLHFDAFVTKLNAIAGEDRHGALVATHIDSWEGGGQNWSSTFRDEFKSRRGYDPASFLPVFAGRVIGDLRTSERFLFDVRQTVSELTIANYSGEFQRLAHEAGLRCTFESYTTIAHDLDNAMQTDEPMAEFWTPNGQGLDFQPTIKSMSSAAHLNGQSVVGAESFTSGGRERWLWHPAMLKAIGDTAFAGGVNRFVFHRYAMQPFAPGVVPGMQMGPWGLHYERTNTWWEFSQPWHGYLARCQYLLRQGRSVADVLKLEGEEPLHRFQQMPLTGYDYDACGPATLGTASVKDGRIVFPSGASYRLLVLPDGPTMSVALLTRIRDLARSGATIVGEPPVSTPGLSGLPRADDDLKRLVDEVWGNEAPSAGRSVGTGRVFREILPEQALARMGIAPDVTNDAGLKWIHRTLDGNEIYFLSHPGPDAVVADCTFRVAGREPQVWNPETGKATRLRAYAPAGRDATRVTLPFGPSESMFVVFPKSAPATQQALASVTRNNAPIVDRSRYVPLPPGAPAPIDLVSGETDVIGNYVLTTTDGKSSRLTVPRMPTTQPAGAWHLTFQAGRGAPAAATMDRLVSLGDHADAAVRHFAGTVTYANTVVLPPAAPGQRRYLDLGDVQVMARVRVNGQDLGVVWKPPYRLDITDAARPGENALEVDVVTLWVNGLIGDEQLPEDSDRTPKRTLKAWPTWLTEGKPSPAGRLTFSSWRLWTRDEPLVPAGLLGPVKIESSFRLWSER